VKGMSLIVKTMTRLVLAFIVTFGVYVVLFGHLSPGGGFSGGVVLAAGLILVMLAFGKEYAGEICDPRHASVWDSVGALGFLAVALLGYVGGVFFLNFFDKGKAFHLFSGGSIPYANIAIGLKVGACLYLALVVTSAFRTHRSERE